jgi:hypothetical protein
MVEMDALGGSGLGPYWFADPDAPITLHPTYQMFSQQKLSGIDANQVKTALGTSYPSAESAPLISYLRWLIETLANMA